MRSPENELKRAALSFSENAFPTSAKRQRQLSENAASWQGQMQVQPQYYQNKNDRIRVYQLEMLQGLLTLLTDPAVPNGPGEEHSMRFAAILQHVQGLASTFGLSLRL